MCSDRLERPDLLSIQNLSVRIHTDTHVVRAVENVSLSVRAGETLGIVGESGCGKTMTALSILQLLPRGGRVAKGRILWREAGTDEVDLTSLTEQSDEIARMRGGRVGMVFQEPKAVLSPVHTIGHHIAEALANHGIVAPGAERERAVDLLASVGVPRPASVVDSYPHQLSGGMRQRALIAVAIACDPRLLIADEPTTSLDVTIQAQVLALIASMKESMGMAMILITHDLAVIAETATSVAVMYYGRVVESGSVDDIFHRAAHPYTRALLHALPDLSLRRKTDLPTIPGSVPPPGAEYPGCPFVTRCSVRVEVRCNDGFPEATTLGPGHVVHCIHEGRL